MTTNHDPNLPLVHHFHTQGELVDKIKEGYNELPSQAAELTDANKNIQAAMSELGDRPWPNSAVAATEVLAEGLKALEAIANRTEVKSVLSPDHPMSVDRKDGS